MQRKVVRRARTRDASTAQADGPHPARLAGAFQRVSDPDRPNFRFCRQPPCAWVLFGRTSPEQKLESGPNSSRISVQHQTPSKRKPADQSSTATSPDAIQSHTSSPPLERRSALDVAGFRRVLHRAPPFRLSRAVQIPGTTSSFQLCGGIASTETLPRAHGEMESEVESVVTPLIPHSIRSS